MTCSDDQAVEAAARKGRRLLPVPFRLYPAANVARQTFEQMKREAYEEHRKRYTVMNAKRQLALTPSLKQWL